MWWVWVQMLPWPVLATCPIIVWGHGQLPRRTPRHLFYSHTHTPGWSYQCQLWRWHYWQWSGTSGWAPVVLILLIMRMLVVTINLLNTPTVVVNLYSHACQVSLVFLVPAYSHLSHGHEHDRFSSIVGHFCNCYYKLLLTHSLCCCNIFPTVSPLSSV